MAMMKQQKIGTPIQLISSRFHLKKLVTKILVPFSVLSVVLSYPLLCNIHILAHGLQFFSFSVGKNYMFLLCNGLLVCIATSSGLIGSFSVETDAFEAGKTPIKSQRELKVRSSDKQKESIVVETKVIPQVNHQVAQESKMDSLALVRGIEDEPEAVQDEGDQDLRHELVSIQEDHEDGLGFMTNEELNRKCEEFIRKMKEGIRFETKQRIMVK